MNHPRLRYIEGSFLVTVEPPVSDAAMERLLVDLILTTSPHHLWNVAIFRCETGMRCFTRLEADEIIVKPFEASRLAELLHEKISTRKPAARADKERVAAILLRSIGDIVQSWLTRVKRAKNSTTFRLQTWNALDIFRN
jgi:hypothetical protein